MNLQELQALATQVGFPDPTTAAAVAMAESKGDPSAQNIVTDPAPGNGPERSFGLWQVNTLAHPEYDEQSLLDPTYNAHAALAISHGGTNWIAWSTYTHGDYLKYIPAGPLATATSNKTAGKVLLAALIAGGVIYLGQSGVAARLLHGRGRRRARA